MSRCRHHCPFLRSAAMGLLVATMASAATQDELLTALAARGLPVDTQALHAVALDAMIKSIDHRAAWQMDGTEEVPVKSLAAMDTWEEQVRYIKLQAVGDDVPETLANSAQWRTPDLRAIILDLRDAGGNSAGGAADVARELYPALATPYLLDASGQPFLAAPTGVVAAAATPPIPLAVVVNAGTHGAAEVVAAALSGADGVIVIGEPTEGDLAFRENLRINEQQVLRVATTRYHLTNNATSATNRCQVQPDILIAAARASTSTNPPLGRVPENDVRLRPLSERATQDRALMRRVQDDAPLQRAVDVLLGLQALDSRTMPARKEATKEPDEATADPESEPAAR